MTETDRATCPDCGKTVPVNKGGDLRKHQCEPPAAVPVDEHQAVPVDGQPDSTEPPAAAPARPVKDPRLCGVGGCDRPRVLGRLCGAHYASQRGGWR